MLRRRKLKPLRNTTKDKKTEKNDTEKEITCYQCGKKGHKSTKCPSKDKNKGKKISLMHHEDNQDPVSTTESSPESLPDSDESDNESSGYSTNAILCSEEKVIANIQPLSDKQKPNKVKILPLKKPDYTGRMHKSGGTNITNIICNKFKIKCLIDGGAYCSIISPRLLEKILPDWRSKLQL